MNTWQNGGDGAAEMGHVLHREGTYRYDAVTGAVDITLNAVKPNLSVKVVENGQTREEQVKNPADEEWAAAIPTLCLRGKVSETKPARCDARLVG